MIVHQEEQNGEEIDDVTVEVIHEGSKKQEVVCIVCDEEVKSLFV